MRESRAEVEELREQLRKVQETLDAIRRGAAESLEVRVPAGVVGIAVAGAETRRIESHFRSVAEAMPHPVWIVRTDGTAEYTNGRWTETTGLEAEASMGLGWQEALHPVDLPALLDRIRTPDETFQAEVRVRGADGTFRWHLARATPLRDEAGEIRWIGSSADIDALKRLQAERDDLLIRERVARFDAERANRLKDEFLATLSHELRTPLNAILGWTYMFRTGTLDEPEVRYAMEVIERNARNQAQLIEDLLDMSRIITGRLRLETGMADLGAVVRAALDACRVAAEARDIRLEAHLDLGLGGVWCDAARLQQVVGNLLSNAIKFNRDGGRVEVVLDQVGGSVRIAVRDDGIGIRPDHLGRVFDRFMQADLSTTRRHSGLGIGLSIVRQLVELHGGTISAQSEGDGKGACFTVLLPRRPSLPPGAAMDGAMPVERRAISRLPSLAGVRVLVVDDEPDACNLHRLVLERQEATVDVAPSAEEGLRRIREARPDVLVSDIGMPDVDGYTFLARVRGTEQEIGTRIPAVALTAFARPEDRERALGSGYQIHLTKPADPKDLIAAVAALCGRSGAQ